MSDGVGWPDPGYIEAIEGIVRANPAYETAMLFIGLEKCMRKLIARVNALETAMDEQRMAASGGVDTRVRHSSSGIIASLISDAAGGKK